MIKKKVCMIGGPGVGKTSLVRRFVEGIFGERYHTTLGVKIDRKVVPVGETDVLLVIWDIAGMEELSTLSRSYLRGASGFLLVADYTRPRTVDLALSLRSTVHDVLGDVPHAFLRNKVDLIEEPMPSVPEHLDAVPLDTSAKTGANVELAFRELAVRLVNS